MMMMPTTMQMILPIITMVMIVLSTMTPNVCVVSAFHNSVVPLPSSPRQSSYIRLKSISRSSSDSTTTTTNVIVEKLIQQVIIDDGKEGAVDPTNTTNQKNLRDTSIRDLMTDLSSIQQVSNTSTNEDLFGPLLGYYNVSYTLTENPNDNPVGGKWTRSLWTVKRTLQHVLPPLPSSEEEEEEEDDDEKGKTVKATVVAQVVNAIKLDCLWGFVGIWVLLRGDAVPLKDDQDVKNIKEEESNGTKNEKKKNKKSPRKLLPDLTDRTVRVYFDQPKIGISLFRKTSLLNNNKNKNKNKKKLLSQRVLNLGPTSSVVLDTPYNDNRIRLGKGGTSGSQFVFCRINDEDNIDIDAKEGWKWMLDDNKIIGRSLTKKKLMLRLGIVTFVFSLSYRIIQHQYRWMKIGAGISSIISCISMLWLSTSTGGIETRGNSFSKGRG